MHDVTLDIDGKRLRSSLLPWTIGLDVDRTNPNEGANVVLRESDIVGHRIADLSGESVIVGISSIGVKRLLWFDLTMTAYLDSAGLLDEADRRIDLVYYDIRDVEFEDIGLSPRMLDSIMDLARGHGFDRFETLSDVLAWLVHRGFHIRICVDEGRSREDAVSSFLSEMESKSADGEGTLEVFVKEIDFASMHKKVLITPLWALMGSANLTESGTGRSEEIEAHVLSSNPNYQLVQTSCNDTFHGARPL
jgi:hypothetical protein